MCNRPWKVFTVILLAVFVGYGPVSYGQTAADEQSIINVGVGFGGGLGAPGISYSLLPNYSGTNSPGLMLSFEHTFEKEFGISGIFSYSSASYSLNNLPYSVVDPAGNVLSAGTLSDKANGSYMAVAGRPLYHFKNTGKVDLYAGVIFGFTFTSFQSTVTTVQGSYAANDFYPGILFGAVAGARYFVSKTIGIWFEAGYCGMPDYLVNIGVAFKIPKKF